MDRNRTGLAETASEKAIRRVARWFEAIALVREAGAFRSKQQGQTRIEEELDFQRAVVKRFESIQDD